MGCGLCVQICPQGAINLMWGRAEIDDGRCNYCYQCVDACPQGAIIKTTKVSPEELEATVCVLKNQTDDMIQRIDRLVNKA